MVRRSNISHSYLNFAISNFMVQRTFRIIGSHDFFVIWVTKMFLVQRQWFPMEHNILLIGDSFNWRKIVSCNFRDKIEKYQKTSSSLNPTFYMFGFFMDALCPYSPFLNLNWFRKEESLPVNIYLSNMWKDKFIP